MQWRSALPRKTSAQLVSILNRTLLTDADSNYLAWIEGFAIFLGVFVVAGVGSYNDWQKEKQFIKLQAESDKDNTVSAEAEIKN